MAPNKFATMLNRKTNRITLVLVYALLEWGLIFFLLLNSLFSYLIVKFANYFGLKLPCLVCSRIDHVFEPQNSDSKSSYRDLICEQHAIELSRSGYCSHHRKLVESQDDMCEDCWSSHKGNHRQTSALLAFRWLKEIGKVKSDAHWEVVENFDLDANLNSRCCCCGVGIKSEFLAPLATDSLNTDGMDKDEVEGARDIQIGPTTHSDIGKGDDSSESFSFWLSKEGYSLVQAEEDDAQGDQVLEAETEPLLKGSAAPITDSYADEKIIPPEHLEFYIDLDDYQLIPVESGKSKAGGEGDQKSSNQETVSELWRVRDEELVVEHDITVAPAAAALDVVENLNSSSLYSFALNEMEIEELVLEHDITVAPAIAAALDVVEKPNSSSLDSFALNEELVLEHDNIVAPAAAALDVVENLNSSSHNTEIEELVLEDDITAAPAAAAIDAVEKPNSSSLDSSELNEMEIEELIQENDITVAPAAAAALDVVEKPNSSSLDSFALNETEIEELVLEQDITVAPVAPAAAALDVVEKLNSSSLDSFGLNEMEIVEFVQEHDITGTPAAPDVVESFNKSSLDLFELGQEQEIKGEIDVGVEPDEIHIEEVPSEKCQEEEDIKREVSDTMALDEDKVEMLPSVHGQAAATTRYMDFNGGIDQQPNVALSTIGDEVVAENMNILTSDFGDVYHNGNYEIDIVNSSVKLVDTSQVAEHLRPCKDECPSTDDVICEASNSFSDLLDESDYEARQTGTTKNYDDTKVEITEPELESEVDRERIPGPPNSEESLSHLHSEMQLLGSESSETLDGSIGNELDEGEEVAIIEELKSLLEYERNALHALYAELDEERNASAVATNQTMAMINRLQEEKATIEMEALQYQRMMEEQSEYDQEALQLMNEMLIKREKELQELEKELEVCRKKLMDYEERERMRLLSQRRDRSCTRGRNSSASRSNGEESDEVSVDLNNESRDEDGYCKCEENGHHQHTTPVDAIVDFQDSLSSFEEERMSILGQLKVLEEKLCSLAEEEEHHIENMKSFEQFYEDNATEFDREFQHNGGANGTFAINGKHHEGGRLNGSMPKQLLPLFNAAELESDSELSNGVEDGMGPLTIHKPLPTKYELEKKRLAIEEEVDHVYERLHALEADREFIKHCIGSLRKGDKGVHLLQEILQHLRDLKNVELEARNICGGC